MNSVPNNFMMDRMRKDHLIEKLRSSRKMNLKTFEKLSRRVILLDTVPIIVFGVDIFIIVAINLHCVHLFKYNITNGSIGQELTCSKLIFTPCRKLVYRIEY